MNVPQSPPATRYEIRYRSLLDPEHALSFPCDDRGRVDLDALGERTRLDYFYARTVVGREFALPTLRRITQ
jgi:hypothetical protein